LSLKLQSAANTLVDDHLVRPLLQDLDKSVAELSDDIRHLAFQYHPSILDDLGLGSALRSLCEDFSRWEKIRITCELPEATRQIPQNVASCLYRVAQESLRNVSKHARASAAHLVLKEDKQEIFFVIRDNGRGFLLKEKLPQGLGFVSMKERVRLVGGTIAVESQTGQGTTVRVSIPKEANYT
jgi:signal transduction histidine kinase